MNEGMQNDNEDSRDPVENLSSADLYYMFLIKLYAETLCRYVSACVGPGLALCRNLSEYGVLWRCRCRDASSVKKCVTQGLDSTALIVDRNCAVKYYSPRVQKLS